MSCLNATSCVATGFSFATSTEANARPFLAIRSGKTWHIDYTGTDSDPNGKLNGIGCHRSCVAVGQTNARYLFVTRTGAGLSRHLQTKPAGSRGGSVDAVSCANGGFCAAIDDGYLDEPALVRMRRTATATWTLNRVVNTGGVVLNDISCPSSMFCAVIGLAGDFNHPDGLSEFWDGTQWTPKPLPFHGYQAHIVCASSTSCLAFGRTNGQVTPPSYWDGSSWSSAPPALPSGATTVDIEQVSCAVETYCVGIGHDQADNVVAELWNGSAWSLLPAPTDSGLLSCPTLHHCVMLDTNASPVRTETFDGSTWTSTAGPPSPGLSDYPDAEYTDLSCVSATQCTATVTAYSDDEDTKDCPMTYNVQCSTAVVTEWDGTSWQDALLPLPAETLPNDVTVPSVSCASDGGCTWVGTAYGYHNQPIEGTRSA